MGRLFRFFATAPVALLAMASASFSSERHALGCEQASVQNVPHASRGVIPADGQPLAANCQALGLKDQLASKDQVLAAKAQPAAAAQPDAAEPAIFSYDTVVAKARALSQFSFKPVPAIELPNGHRLDYDRYRAIWFDTKKAIWKGEGAGLELQLFPTGWLYQQPIELNVVEDGQVRAIKADRNLFNVGPQAAEVAKVMPWALSGFRINGPLNRRDVSDEIAVFQGASYFRGLSRGQQYGLSARGLALAVASPAGEEFPFFKEFWVEKPAADQTTITVHALLDSRSVAGAYRFEINPGAPTSMDVTVTLFPRKDLTDAGLAPLTSMNLLGTLNPHRVADFRPRVHDSDGLSIINGSGERIWRPLNNPRRLQMSWFVDTNPRGFGLAQRARAFPSYLDLQARYERRPSAWVTPLGDWGRGSVVLVEIPAEEEIHDNIVAFWRPETPLMAGKAHVFRYRLDWPNHTPTFGDGAHVLRSRVGPAFGAQGRAGIRQFIIDYDGLTLAPGEPLPKATVSASTGAVQNVVVVAINKKFLNQDNPENSPVASGTEEAPVGGRAALAAQATEPDGALRVGFQFDPGGATSAEFRLQLTGPQKAETWLYRWTQEK